MFILKPLDTSSYNRYKTLLDQGQGDLSFLSDYPKKTHNFYRVYIEDQELGVLIMTPGVKAYYAYYLVSPSYEEDLIRFCEDHLIRQGAKILAIGLGGHLGNRLSLLEARAYKRAFASEHMVYKGSHKTLDHPCIRPYEDKDYVQAHKLYAQAFHRMRVEVGDFPDSEVEKESDEMKRKWAATKDQRWVYEEDHQVLGVMRVVASELSTVSVAPSHQGKGIGRALVESCMTHILERHDHVDLWCVVGNRAKKLYSRLGFKVVNKEVYMEKQVTLE